MKASRIHWIFHVACIFLAGANAESAGARNGELLGTVRAGTLGAVTFFDVFPDPVTDVVFSLGYIVPDSNGNLSFQKIQTQALHVAGPLPVVQTFDATDPGFVELAARLTNGTDEQLRATYMVFNADGSEGFPSGGSGGDESWLFETATDLRGFDITAIELEVRNFEYRPGRSMILSADWKIFGVPEPSTGALFLTGSLLLSSCRSAYCKPRIITFNRLRLRRGR